MKILEQLAEAVNTVDEIKARIMALVLEQNEIEKKAYLAVYGMRLDLDLDPDGFQRITDDGVVEAWRYGHWGGEDWIDWERPLDPLMDMESPKSREDLYAKFFTEYTAEKEAEQARVSKLNQERRAKLMAELQGLDKE
jgi:hypothetical protein